MNGHQQAKPHNHAKARFSLTGAKRGLFIALLTALIVSVMTAWFGFLGWGLDRTPAIAGWLRQTSLVDDLGHPAVALAATTTSCPSLRYVCDQNAPIPDLLESALIGCRPENIPLLTHGLFTQERKYLLTVSENEDLTS